MKYPAAHNTRRNPISHLPALLMTVRTQEEMAALYSGEIVYAHFEYDPGVPRLLQAGPKVHITAEPCHPEYWPERYRMERYFNTGYPPIIGHSHTHVAAKRQVRVYGDTALRASMQAHTRALLVQRADARRAEWDALARVNA